MGERRIEPILNVHDRYNRVFRLDLRKKNLSKDSSLIKRFINFLKKLFNVHN